MKMASDVEVTESCKSAINSHDVGYISLPREKKVSFGDILNVKKVRQLKLIWQSAVCARNAQIKVGPI